MKKFLFLAAAMLMFALPAANAQKVNTAKEIAALEKADAACLDAKKNRMLIRQSSQVLLLSFTFMST